MRSLRSPGEADNVYIPSAAMAFAAPAQEAPSTAKLFKNLTRSAYSLEPNHRAYTFCTVLPFPAICKEPLAAAGAT